MPDLLVRDIDLETKGALASRAAAHGNSLQAETRQILMDAVRPRGRGIVALLRGAAGADLDGFETPQRHEARTLDLW